MERAYFEARDDPAFQSELDRLLKHYVGRPTPVYEARRLTRAFGGARIFLKREDLTHTGAHKINNALGQALLAVRMGKRRIVAETGAGQHGVATATACALLGLDCFVYMGSEDMERQALNVFRMRLLGATVRRVEAGSRTLKDAINEAMRDWVTNVEDTYYVLGSVLGPHPYPLMVREFQSVIGREARAQIVELAGRLPDAVVACVGGGSNAMGIFDAFIGDAAVRLIGVEAGGEEIVKGRHAARFAGGSAGILQGTRTFVLQDDNGNIELTHSISAGLDYAGVGPEHSWLRATGRTEYVYASDEEALEAFQTLARLEGILPALESAHAIAYARACARDLGPDSVLLVNLSGRGDKDVNTVEKALEIRSQRSKRAVAGRRSRCRDGHRVRGQGNVKSRITQTFAKLRAEKRAGLVTYTTAGDPDLPRSARILKALDRAGADVLEVGVPFSDPLADGPVIQRATERALAAGGCLSASLALVAEVRAEVSAPIVIFSYANPLMRMGLETFARQAAASGVDGVLALDLPIEEAEEFRQVLTAAGLDTIFLLSPTTTDARIRRAAELGSGFLYGISRLGVTGARDTVATGATALVGAHPRPHLDADCARVRHLTARARQRSVRLRGRRGRWQRARVVDCRGRRVAGVGGPG